VPGESGGVADSKEKAGKIFLPKRRETVVEDFGPEPGGDAGMEFEAAGGMA
jgi:hypothetical protein